MKFDAITPPREFTVGHGKDTLTLKDCGRLALAPDELVTLTTEEGSEYDITRKPWGFYATPSMNGRLVGHGLRACLSKGRDGKYYVFLVEKGKEDEFFEYVKWDKHTFITWLDSDEVLADIESKITAEDEE